MVGGHGSQALVDEVDHPGEAVVDVGVDLEPAGRLERREPVQDTAQHPHGVNFVTGGTILRCWASRCFGLGSPVGRAALWDGPSSPEMGPRTCYRWVKF